MARLRSGLRRQVAWLLFGTVLVVACTGSDEQTTSRPAATVEPTATSAPPTTTEVAPTEVAPTAPATAVPTPNPEPTATPTPSLVPPLPGVNAIGDLVAAAPGTFITARPGAGFPLDNGALIVPVYDVPDGAPRALVDRNEIDNIEQAYPLRNPTVFGEPLVLRVIAGTPVDEWVLVQAPVRPHRQHVWVRTEDFVFGQSSLRFEVDLSGQGRFTLFNGEREVINNSIVYGREGRPTVLHDTYVEQAFGGDTLSPAYGSYIFTIASYSEALGTFGGGLPGQSIHGTNQPELMGQRVSSGGIRMPNEVIDFIYAQPGIVGASVLIYDSTGIGREAAIALQRNKPWTRAETVQLDPTNLPDVPIPSYS